MFVETVTQKLLQVVRKIGQQKSFEQFAMGGGTSLALRFGHRRSVDIDLFNIHPFDTEQLLHECKLLFGEVNIFNRTLGSLCLSIDGVKVDILHHAYPLLEPIEVLDGIRILSLEDLSAMKINAVTNRGSKKDFVDLLLLHNKGICLEESLTLFEKKYGKTARFISIRSLLFFDDADKEPDPVFMNDWTWQFVREQMSKIAQELM